MLETPERARAEPSIICNDAGRQIDFNDEQPANACASIRVSCDPDSNVNDESESQKVKQPSYKIPTEAGRQIDVNDG
jgi:hypothetical protein